jgi:hypothetical protein
MSKANIKGKIILGVGATIIVGGISFLIYSAIRKKKVSDRIYKALNDTSGEGFQSMLQENEQILGSSAFDPNFWKGEGTVKPDPKFFNNFTTSNARSVARNIYDAQAKFWKEGGWTDDEAKIVAEIKKLQSKGQVSLVAYVYQSTPLSFGNLGKDIINATTGFFDDEVHIKEINNHINNLPF